MCVLRLLLVACALFGPTAAQAGPLVCEEEAAEVSDDAAIERGTLACQRPLPGRRLPFARVATRRRSSPVITVRIPTATRPMRGRLMRRLTFAVEKTGSEATDGDDDDAH
jgi:hypothetical protein